MDKQTYIQFDRIEAKIDRIGAGMEVLTGETAEEVVIGFLEKEVYGKDGKLKHLREDVELRKFYDELTEDETPEENKEEYSQNE